MNNFIFENGTKVILGKGCVKEYLACFLRKYGNNVMLAYVGVEALADFIREIGLPVSLRDLGVTEETDLKEIADSCVCVQGAYKVMDHEETLEIFQECFQAS